MQGRPDGINQTQKDISDAFWRLYTELPISKIGVKEVCALAGYSRGTFYRYYRDVYEVLEQIEREILEQFEMRFNRIARCSSRLDLADLVKFTFAPCKVYNKYLVVMLGERGDPAFQKRLRESTKAALRRELEARRGPLGEESEFYLEYCVSGLLSCTRMWYEKKSGMDINDYISLILKILSNPLGFLP